MEERLFPSCFLLIYRKNWRRNGVCLRGHDRARKHSPFPTPAPVCAGAKRNPPRPAASCVIDRHSSRPLSPPHIDVWVRIFPSGSAQSGTYRSVSAPNPLPALGGSLSLLLPVRFRLPARFGSRRFAPSATSRPVPSRSSAPRNTSSTEDFVPDRPF